MGAGLELERGFGDITIGIDEAGRGPLAGPVYAAAVSVPLASAERLIENEWRSVNDSKRLSPEKREALAQTIKTTPGCVWAVASASAEEIDSINILNATHLAMRRALAEVEKKLPPDEKRTVLIDGLKVESIPGSVNIVKGDLKSLLIAAASILAKTARDEDCLRLERLYPGYGFAGHKGYPTKAHCEALSRLGPCAEHRRSFRPVKEALR